MSSTTDINPPPNGDAVAADTNINTIPQLPDQLLNSMTPEVMAAMMPNASLLTDPSMAAMQMSMADPSFMMGSGMVLPNGQDHGFNLPVSQQATVSAGRYIFIIMSFSLAHA